MFCWPYSVVIVLNIKKVNFKIIEISKRDGLRIKNFVIILDILEKIVTNIQALMTTKQKIELKY